MSNTLTLSPEIHHEIDIREVVHGMIDASATSEQVDELFAEIVENADRLDLQAGTILERSEERDRLLAPFVTNPYASVVAENSLLSRLSERRTITRNVGLQQVASFVTRSAAEDGIDSLYSTITKPDGSSYLTIASHLQGQLEEPCFISTFGGRLSISERTWRRGEWHYVEREITDGSRGDKLFRASIGSFMWASHLAMTREADVRQDADAHAYDLMAEEAKTLRGTLALTYTV